MIGFDWLVVGIMFVISVVLGVMTYLAASKYDENNNDTPSFICAFGGLVLYIGIWVLIFWYCYSITERIWW